MNAERFETFSKQYREELKKIADADPNYFMPGRPLEQIATNMLTAIEDHGIRAVTITNSKGFTATAKALGIKCNYKSFELYLSGED